MKSELDTLIENLHWHDPYFGEWSQEAAVVFGWARCKQKVLEILSKDRYGISSETSVYRVLVRQEIENL